MKIHFLPKFISIFQNFKVGNANDEKRGLFPTVRGQFQSPRIFRAFLFLQLKLLDNEVLRDGRFTLSLGRFTQLSGQRVLYLVPGYIRTGSIPGL